MQGSFMFFKNGNKWLKSHSLSLKCSLITIISHNKGKKLFIKTWIDKQCAYCYNNNGMTVYAKKPSERNVS